MLRVAFLLLVTMSKESTSEADLDICKACNIFPRFGFFSFSMSVAPQRGFATPQIFREPLVNIFQNCSSFSCEDGGNKIFHGEFHLEFCDNVNELKEAYFRNFKIELVDKPWQAFTASWSKATIAAKFGIDKTFVINPHSYILVRLARQRVCKFINKQSITANTEIIPHARELAEQVQVGNETSVYDFISKFGSHYISSFSTGNTLYQVFAFHPAVYRRLKTRINAHGISGLKKDELYTIFSPWYSEHVGLILSASGNLTLSEFVTSFLTSKSHLHPFTSLIKLFGRTRLLKKLNDLMKNEALLGLHLETLAPVFKDVKKRKWFLEVLSNNIKLWESNI